MTTSEKAIHQIREKGYDLPFRTGGKTIILSGIAFDKESRNIADWLVEHGPSSIIMVSFHLKNRFELNHR